MPEFSIYILECADGTLYIGHTDNLDARMLQHQTAPAGYTASRRPLKLLYVEEFQTRIEAKSAEHKLKGWSRAKKLAYIRNDWDAIKLLAKGSRAGTGRQRASGDHNDKQDVQDPDC